MLARGAADAGHLEGSPEGVLGARGHDDADGPLRAWYTHVNSKTVSWLAWGDVRASFPSASIVGDCVVFNIGGNKYRLICRIRYTTQKVFVLKVMTHSEYDEDKWKGRMRVL